MSSSVGWNNTVTNSESRPSPSETRSPVKFNSFWSCSQSTWRHVHWVWFTVQAKVLDSFSEIHASVFWRWGVKTDPALISARSCSQQLVNLGQHDEWKVGETLRPCVCGYFTLFARSSKGVPRILIVLFPFCYEDFQATVCVFFPMYLSCLL